MGAKYNKNIKYLSQNCSSREDGVPDEPVWYLYIAARWGVVVVDGRVD